MSNYVEKSGEYEIHHYHSETKDYLFSEKRFIQKGMGTPRDSTLDKYRPKKNQIGNFKEGVWTYREDVNLVPRWFFDGSPVVGLGIDLEEELTTRIEPPKWEESMFVRFDKQTKKWTRYSKVKEGKLFDKGTGIYTHAPEETIYDNEKYTKQIPTDLEYDETTQILKFVGDTWKVFYRKGILVWNTETLQSHPLENEVETLPKPLVLEGPDITGFEIPKWSNGKWEVDLVETLKDSIRQLLVNSDRLVSTIDYEIAGKEVSEEMRRSVLEWRKTLREMKRASKTKLNKLVKEDNPIPNPPSWVDFSYDHYFNTKE